MKKIALGVCLLLLVSCSKDSPSIYPEQEVEVRFHSGVSAATMVETRAPILGSAFDQGEEVGIYGMVATKDNMNTIGWSATTNVLTTLYNARYVASSPYYDNGGYKQGLLQDDVAKFPQRSTPTDPEPALVFYAYYPYMPFNFEDESHVYNEGRPDPPTIKLTLNADDMSKTPDYMFAKVASPVTNEPIHLEFEHLLARMDFHLYTDIDDFGEATGEVCLPELLEVKVVQNFSNIAKFTLTEKGAITTTQQLNKSLIYPLNTPKTIEYLPNESQNRFTGVSYLLFPTTRIGSIDFKIRTEKGIERTITVYTYDANSSDPLKQRITLEAGKTTKVMIKYTREVRLHSSVSEWEEEAFADGAEIIIESPEN